MTLKLETVYRNVDKEFLDWWIKNNGPNYGVKSIHDLPASLDAKDPTGPVMSRTTIMYEETP